MEKYQIKSEIDHILDRSGTYVGSIYDDVVSMLLYKPSENRMVMVENATYNAGLQKLFDEILSNSVDEHRRSDAMFKINQIDVTINEDGTITVFDNGGIPVVNHKQASKTFGKDVLVPELIFGYLRTSSNYDDTQDRNVVGTNGLGAKLTNIFSTEFTVETADGKNSIEIRWSNNMRECVLSDIKPTKAHYTKITFKIDLKRFNLTKLTLGHIRQMQKRCIDACATNPNLVVNFQSDIVEGKLNGTFQYKSFKEYAELYYGKLDSEDILIYDGNRIQLSLVTQSLGYDIAFVNGAMCCEGTHIKVISKQISDVLLEYCKKNGMELINEKDIFNSISIFASCVVRNPTYDSQTKTKLSNKLTKYDLKLDEKFLKSILNSKIIVALQNYYELKYAAEKRKETKKLNAALRSTKVSSKLIACTSRSNNKELLIFEGTSASGGFRKFRNPQTQSAYMLRGKIRNAFNLERAKILENQELREIIALLELQFDSPKQNLKNLGYSKIIIYSDADYDGDHISGLLLAFITKHFPELIQAGKVFRAITPIVVAVNKLKEKRYFYTLSEFEKAQSELKGYEIRYTKGLGGLDDDDYSIILNQQNLLRFDIIDVNDIESVQIWFDKDSTERKKILADNQEEN